MMACDHAVTAGNKPLKTYLIEARYTVELGRSSLMQAVPMNEQT